VISRIKTDGGNFIVKEESLVSIQEAFSNSFIKEVEDYWKFEKELVVRRRKEFEELTSVTVGDKIVYPSEYSYLGLSKEKTDSMIILRLVWCKKGDWNFDYLNIRR